MPGVRSDGVRYQSCKDSVEEEQKPYGPARIIKDQLKASDLMWTSFTTYRIPEAMSSTKKILGSYGQSTLQERSFMITN